MSEIKHFKIVTVFEKLRAIRPEHSRVDVLYMDMHVDAVDDLLRDAMLETYMNERIYDRESLEKLFGCRIFTHNDNDKRDIIAVLTKTEMII